jgi:DNA-directed RNA polymerase specialized sigma24 family protein
MTSSPISLHAQLEAQDWPSIIIRLSAYAVSLCRFGNVTLPGGQLPEDLAMDAIDRVYRQERNWNSEQDADLMAFLKSVVKSLLSNLRTSLESRTPHEEAEAARHVAAGGSSQEEELYCRELDQQILIRLRGDPPLCLVYKALKDGYRPAEIAEEYGLDIREVRNTQKRLHRAVLEVLTKSESNVVI